MRKLLLKFLARWLACSLGLWIAASILGSGRISLADNTAIIVGGLILAVVNMFLKPIVVLLSLPAVLLSLGLFMIIINGLMVYLVSLLYAPIHVANFGWAVLAGLIIGLVNYLVTTIIEGIAKK